MSIFTDKLVARAQGEQAAYQGVLENVEPLKSRIGLYWDNVDRPDLDGGDDVPWSAAFICYMVRLAGGGDTFPKSAQHSVYLYRTINDKLAMRARPFLGYRVGEVTIAPGDIVGMNRAAGPAISYDEAAHDDDYKSHADIVVGVDAAGTIHTIGGNVGRAPGEIGAKSFSMHNGKLVNAADNRQQVFVVIRSFLP